jgi:glycosyltransferase involved in cell wall biosynthesis
MRLVYVVSSLSVGGAERHVANLVAAMRAAGHSVLVAVLTGESGELEAEIETAGARIERAELADLIARDSPARIRRLARCLDAFGPDLIHAHLYHAEVVGALLARRWGIPLLVTRHSKRIPYSRARRIFLRIVLPRRTGVVAVCPEAREEAIGLGTSGKRIWIVPNSVDLGKFRPAADRGEMMTVRSELASELGFEPEAGETWIGSVGNLRAVKNFMSLVEAAARLRDGGERLRFFLAGGGDEAIRLRDRVRALGLEGTFHLLGPRMDVPRLLRSWDLYVSCSRREGVSLALLEAAASGLGLVASPVGGNRDLVELGMALPVTSVDAEGIAASLGRALEERKRGAMPRPDPEALASRFGTGPWGERHLEIYRELLEARDPTRGTFPRGSGTTR